MWTSRGIGVYVASEAHTCASGRLYKGSSSRRPVVYFPGGVGGDRKFLDDSTTGSQIGPLLAECGYPIISAAFGGPSLWGNSTTATRIGQAWTQVKSQLSTATDKMLLIGVSQGATAALNYAKSNPSNVAAIVGIVPAVDIQDIDTNNRGGASTAIQTAHGGAPSDALTPAKNASSFTAIPQKLYYASDDTTVIPSTVTTFAATSGASTVNLGAVGHTAATVDPQSVVSFLSQYA